MMFMTVYKSKLENIFAKIPMFNKIVEMVDDVEIAAPYVIFVLVHPKDYKVAVKNAGATKRPASMRSEPS